MSIGKRIRALRKSANLRQGELARMAGISQSTLSDLERGDSATPRGDSLMKLAQALKVNPDYLISGEGLSVQNVQPSPEESELIGLFRGLTEPSRQALMAAARAMQDAQEPSEREHSGHRHGYQPHSRKPS